MLSMIASNEFMKKNLVCILLMLSCSSALGSQTLAEAKELFKNKEYNKAFPTFQREYNDKPADGFLNFFYGACLLKTDGDCTKAEECLNNAAKKGVKDANLYLGSLYTRQYRFDEAKRFFDKYGNLLRKKGDEAAHAELDAEINNMTRLRRMVANVEDVQIIDSLVVAKTKFLSAYKLSPSSGKIEYFNQVFSSNISVNSTVYSNEKESKIYFSQPDSVGLYTLYSMDKLLDKFGNERKLSPNNFNLNGNTNYPYVLTDGVTIYFAAEDDSSLGGYDLFVSRYSLNNDNYLVPERLNMPFNSNYNDYMMVIDEEKGVGWFASDRFQPKDSVCIYTFIPNKSVKNVESNNEAYKVKRALITSIKDSWREGTDYSSIISLARKMPQVKQKAVRDFEFIINDKYTYYTLSDFKNKDAYEAYFKAIQARNELKIVNKDLDKLRADYLRMNDDLKKRSAGSILSLERRQEQLNEQIADLEKYARNTEIKSNEF